MNTNSVIKCGEELLKFQNSFKWGEGQKNLEFEQNITSKKLARKCETISINRLKSQKILSFLEARLLEGKTGYFTRQN